MLLTILATAIAPTAHNTYSELEIGVDGLAEVTSSVVRPLVCNLLHPSYSLNLSTLHLRADIVTSRNAAIVRRNKINASSSAASVYLSAKGFFPLLIEVRWRYPTSASLRPKTFLDHRVALHLSPRRQNGRDSHLVAGLAVGPQCEHPVRLRINKHLRRSNVGRNRRMFGTLCWTRF